MDTICQLLAHLILKSPSVQQGFYIKSVRYNIKVSYRRQFRMPSSNFSTDFIVSPCILIHWMLHTHNKRYAAKSPRLTFKNIKLSYFLKFSDFNEEPTNSLMMNY